MELADRAVCDTPTSMENQYQYEPLIAEDAVRVLNLYPANDFQSPLCGFITQHQLKTESLGPDGCKYSAVSYAWGDSTLSHEISIRLGTECTSLLITKNADSLLRYLRDADKERPFWIDGVCLNQKNRGELAQQVPLMGQIYSLARKVHIWLGDEDIEDAQLAFSLIRRRELDVEAKRTITLRPGGEDFLCLEKFFNRPWFSRRWILQEVFFAHDAIFRCGYHTLSLSRVLAVLGPYNVHFQVPGRGARMLRLNSERRGYRNEELLSLLWNFHESECSDKRDRIAAIYAMADDNHTTPLHYDIGSWKEMYMKIASYYLCEIAMKAHHQHTLLSHLCAFGPIESSTNDEVPSWVPNWSTKRQEETILRRIVPIDFEELSWYRFSFDTISRPKSWTQSRDRYRAAWKRSVDSIPQSLEALGRKLEVEYDFLTFIHGCGILDQTVYPALSEDFWDEVVRLFKEMPGRINGRSVRVGVFNQADTPHDLEMDSFRSLLLSILGGRETVGYPAPHELMESVAALCRSLQFHHSNEKPLHALRANRTVLLRSIRSACKNMALWRVQSTVGYYWVIGSPNLVKGDWLTPFVPPGCSNSFQHTHNFRERRIAQYMSLRPIGPGEPRNVSTWYPHPGSDPESRLRHLTRLSAGDIDSVHITTKFAGSCKGCLLIFDEKFEKEVVLWKVFQKATETATNKCLPGPIVFDII